jgi:hypothetical protein
MAEDRAGTDVEHRRHPTSPQIGPNVADRVNATGDSAEQPSGNPILDRAASHPKRRELAPRHKPMLSLRQVSHQPVERIRRTFPMLYMQKVRRVHHRADGEGTWRTGGALRVKSV